MHSNHSNSTKVPTTNTKLWFSFVITVKPTAVHILTKEKFVSADKQYDIECVSTGSKPSAILTWYRGNKPLKRFVKNVSIVHYK